MPRSHDTDVLVVGAGVIGLAIARALALSGRSVIALERESGIGQVTSSRNSEVLHAGFYYPTETLKARLCVAGHDRLFGFLSDRRINVRRTGKLVVAADETEVDGLTRLYRLGAENGVAGLQVLEGADARRLEPELSCFAALLSPKTGVLDAHAYMLALRGDAENAGAWFAFRTPVNRIAVDDRGFVVETGGAAPTRITSTILINAAGLDASAVASTVAGLDRRHIPETRLAKGNYFSLQRRAPFRHLIYPAPQSGGLGVHLTFDLAGRARFGPDVEWVDAIDYRVDANRAEGFYRAIRRYWRSLPDGALTPDYSGIRPKIVGPGDPPGDFRIDGPTAHGVAGLVNLFGIESPGLTASLAIADHVVELCG